MSNQRVFNRLTIQTSPASSFNSNSFVRLRLVHTNFHFTSIYVLSTRYSSLFILHSVPNMRRIRCHTIIGCHTAFRQHKDTSNTLTIHDLSVDILACVDNAQSLIVPYTHTHMHTNTFEYNQTKASIAIPKSVSYNALNASFSRKEKERNLMRMCNTYIIGISQSKRAAENIVLSFRIGFTGKYNLHYYGSAFS